VLITGTTGNLGAQLVDVFLRDGRVKKVYTLNRPSGGEKKKDIRARHAERFVDKGFDLGLLLDERLVILEDASGDHLGLSGEVYEEVCANPFFHFLGRQSLKNSTCIFQMQSCVNLIIHNAWRLDFNLVPLVFRIKHPRDESSCRVCA